MRQKPGVLTEGLFLVLVLFLVLLVILLLNSRTRPPDSISRRRGAVSWPRPSSWTEGLPEEPTGHSKTDAPLGQLSPGRVERVLHLATGQVFQHPGTDLKLFSGLRLWLEPFARAALEA